MKEYYWLIVIGVLIVAYVFLIMRQKRQEKRNLEVLNTFKVGDRVVTHIGIYGRIKRIYNTSYGKTCILEIGNNNKVDIELDMRYIAGFDEKVAVPDEPQFAATKPEEPSHAALEEAQKEENAPVKEEPPKENKTKNAGKKTSNKKSKNHK